ncbi:MAG: type I 3-dehydroquinate dehydratase [Planctomycetota bacterium]|nr:type I 3-dehydroquinate dehydratase [Planctomycetota bacterium]
MICLSLGLQPDSTREDALRVLRRCRRHADIVELRLDLLPHGCIPDLVAAAGRPVVATCRLHGRGGEFRSSLSESFRLLTRAVLAGARFVDVDLRDHPAWTAYIRNFAKDSACDADRLAKAKVVLSYHDFHGTPRNIAGILRSLMNKTPWCAKLCVTTRNAQDAVRLLGLARSFGDARDQRRSRVKRIVIGMGEPGKFSRILYKRLGSVWSYGSHPTDEMESPAGSAAAPHSIRVSAAGYATSLDSAGPTAVAPGQVDVRSLGNLYRADRLDRRTAVFAVVGAPLAHTRSPEYFNRRFRRHGLNGVFIPLELPDLSGFDELARLIELRGASITMPHKTEILRHVRRLSPEATAVSAVNTIVWDGHCYVGYNTDAVGLRSLLRRYGSINGARALVLGAGGAARASVRALAAQGADVTVSNRTPVRASALAHECGVRTIPWQARSGFHADILVNATSVGMGAADGARPSQRDLAALPERRITQSHAARTRPLAGCGPASSEILVPAAALRRGVLVVEWVHTPEVTGLVRAACAKGCRVITGVDLFKAQAREQWKLFKEAIRTR